MPYSISQNNDRGIYLIFAITVVECHIIHFIALKMYICAQKLHLFSCKDSIFIQRQPLKIERIGLFLAPRGKQFGLLTFQALNNSKALFITLNKNDTFNLGMQRKLVNIFICRDLSGFIVISHIIYLTTKRRWTSFFGFE